ncbi:hypothetical protein GCM10025794_17010 [Massilia kyonggiensis]
MKTIDTIYINGAFVTPHGREPLVLLDPATERETTTVILADEVDAQRAIAAAKAARTTVARTTREERMDWLQRLHDAVAAAEQDIVDVMVAEYGGTTAMATGTARRAAASFAIARRLLGEYAFEREVGGARVTMVPHGVVGLITPWNANIGFIATKLSMAIAAGSTAVIKPSELSAAQTALITRVMHGAALPPGVFNIVTGRGDVVGAEITRHPDIAKISFTGFGQHLLLEAPPQAPHDDHRIRHVAGPAREEQGAVAQCLQRRGGVVARQHHHEQRDELQRHRLAAVHGHHAGKEGDEHDDGAQQPLHGRTQADEQRHQRARQHAGQHLVELVAQRAGQIHQARAQRAHRHGHRGRQVGDGVGQERQADDARGDAQAGVEIMTEEERARREGVMHGGTRQQWTSPL